MDWRDGLSESLSCDPLGKKELKSRLYLRSSRKGELILSDKIAKQDLLPNTTPVQFVAGSCGQQKPIFFLRKKSCLIGKLKHGPSLLAGFIETLQCEIMDRL